MTSRRRVSAGIGLMLATRIGHGVPPMVGRVAWIAPGTEAEYKRMQEAFVQRMSELGWRSGETVSYRWGFANGDMSRIGQLVTQSVSEGIDVIVVGSSQGVLAARHVTKSIPIVFAGISDPVGSGFVESLSKPGGNITGTATLLEATGIKLIEFLREIVPAVRRIAILINGTNPAHAKLWEAFQSRCVEFHVDPVKVVASASIELDASIAEIERENAQAVVVAGDSMFFSERVKIHALLQRTRLPVAYQLREHVLAGGLLSYSNDFVAAYAETARFVDRILRGASPGELPVEQPTTFHLTINLRAAKSVGVAIPRSLLLRADEVIE